MAPFFPWACAKPLTPCPTPRRTPPRLLISRAPRAPVQLQCTASLCSKAWAGIHNPNPIPSGPSLISGDDRLASARRTALRSRLCRVEGGWPRSSCVSFYEGMGTVLAQRTLVSPRYHEQHTCSGPADKQPRSLSASIGHHPWHIR